MCDKTGYEFDMNLSQFQRDRLDDKPREASGFSRWLFKRREEDSRIGDLAMDAWWSESWPARARTFCEFWEYMHDIGAWSQCIKNMVDAWEEYSEQKLPVSDIGYFEEKESLIDTLDLPIVPPFGKGYPEAEKGTVYLYALVENSDPWPEVRYIGKTKSPQKRLSQHLYRARGLERKWIDDLATAGKIPMMLVLDRVSDELVPSLERAYIWYFNNLGGNEKLFNKRLTMYWA